MDLSLMRLVGLISGCVFLLFMMKKLRGHAAQRIDVYGLSFFGVALIGISLFPNMINVPTDLLSLGEMRGGRILTLVLMTVCLLCYVTVSNRGKIKTIRAQLNNYIEADLAANLYRAEPDAFAKNDVMVIIPAWNEAENLEKVLPTFPKQIQGRNIKILIVDDGSRDGTAQAAIDAGAYVVTHAFNRGGGAALRTGYAVAERYAVDVVITMDADGQHDPNEIETLLAPIIADEADFVIGSRLLGTHDQYSALRIAGVHFFNNIINRLMGINITDCASGFRAIRFSSLGHVDLMQDQYHTTELIIDAAKKKLRFTERPIHIAARLHGESKKGKNLTYAIGFLKTVLVTWWR